MGPGATLDKRRPDLRDELGYIAPPNRKLPPVPGSNYNTCDRIKRGTVISKCLFRFLNLISNCMPVQSISGQFRSRLEYKGKPIVKI